MSDRLVKYLRIILLAKGIKTWEAKEKLSKNDFSIFILVVIKMPFEHF